MEILLAFRHGATVALLAEGVDRNGVASKETALSVVALLAEGVDRNSHVWDNYRRPAVALLAEGVDRNNKYATKTTNDTQSPSSRRAWIEILQRARR